MCTAVGLQISDFAVAVVIVVCLSSPLTEADGNIFSHSQFLQQQKQSISDNKQTQSNVNDKKETPTFMPITRTVDVFLHQRLGLFIADHNSNVLPRGGAPVGIVIAFFGDFQASPCSSRVLSRVNGQITFELLVSSKQTCAMRRNC